MSTKFKLTSDQSAAVATDYYWDEDMGRCPRGAKVQLLGEGGVAVYGTYNGRDPFWVAWAPCPKRREEGQRGGSFTARLATAAQSLSDDFVFGSMAERLAQGEVSCVAE